MATTKKQTPKTIQPQVPEYIGELLCLERAVPINSPSEVGQHPELKSLPDLDPVAHYRFRRVLAVVSCSLAIAIIILMNVFFFGFHGSLAKIYVGSVQVHATEPTAHMAEQIKTASSKYKLPIKYPDGKQKSFALTDTGISVDSAKSAKQTKQSIGHYYLRRLEWWRPINLSVVTETNKTKLEAFIATQTTQVTAPPTDATMSISGASVVLTPEAIGHGFVVKNSEKTIPKTIANMATKPLVLSPTTISPSITVKDLASSKDKAQAILNSPASFTLVGRTISATSSDIAGWIDLSPVPKSKTVDVTVDSGKILDFINKATSRYITLPRNRVVATTDQGDVVLDSGSSGMDVVGKDKIATQVAAQLQQSKAAAVTLDVEYTPAKTTQIPSYAKWLIADVTNKRMYAYEGTTLVNTFLISAGAPATPTVLGQFKIYAKYASQDMRGSNADGSRYFQPDVPYVNYFSGSYAIHGNYWRPTSWFGNINSSHGCLGVTPDDGKWIYDWAPIGTPVITHS